MVGGDGDGNDDRNGGGDIEMMVIVMVVVVVVVTFFVVVVVVVLGWLVWSFLCYFWCYQSPWHVFMSNGGVGGGTWVILVI